MRNTFKPRDYQSVISDKAVTILNELGIVVFGIEVRCGKTFMALMTAQKIGAKNVLFVTKKKAISSIQDDYNTLNPGYNIEIINYESLHKIPKINYDLIVADESHGISAYPKPSKRAKDLKAIVGSNHLILMSGTLTPESYSQVFWQFAVSKRSPFKHVNFYKWAKDFVDVKDRNLGYAVVKDYSHAKIELIKPIIAPYIITFTQKQAGFSTNVKENVLKVKMNPLTYQLAKRLSRDKVIIAEDGSEILADTAVKLQQKLHQIFSGTVLFEDKTSRIFDTSKFDFIKERFKNNKIAIFYKFKAELEGLKQVFGDDLCFDLETFDSTGKNIALQFISGKEGISLRNADFLVAFNIDFSASTYFQFKDRMSTKDRTENTLYWIFSEDGIEENIYKAVMNKKNYTTAIFKKDFF